MCVLDLVFAVVLAFVPAHAHVYFVPFICETVNIWNESTGTSVVLYILCIFIYNGTLYIYVTEK